jgi:hypothetical protein
MKRKELGEASVRRNYAFSQRTIENFNWLIDHKIYRSETEAIDLAIERMRTIYEMRDEESKTSILVCAGQGVENPAPFEGADESCPLEPTTIFPKNDW